jgi:hypothetical protein
MWYFLIKDPSMLFSKIVSLCCENLVLLISPAAESGASRFGFVSGRAAIEEDYY